MKLQFPKQDSAEVIKKIENAMGGRALADLVSFKTTTSQLLVTISKLGTSTLVFERKENGEKIEFHLKEEKIAFTHKAFKDDIKDKLCKIVEQVGGKVLG